MKKISTFAAAAAIAVAAAAPVAAQETNDPFVSSQASLGLAGMGAGTGLAVVGIFTLITIAAAADS